MPTDYPAGLDDFTNPTSGNNLPDGGVVHSAQHANVNDAVEAVEGELGLEPAGDYDTVRARLDAMQTPFADHDITLSYYNFDTEEVLPVENMGTGGVSRISISSGPYAATFHFRALFGAGLVLPSVDPDDDNTCLCLYGSDFPAGLEPAVGPGDVDPTGQAAWGGAAWISDPAKQPAEDNYRGLHAAFSLLPVNGSDDVVMLFHTLSAQSTADPNQLVGNPQFSGGSVVSRVPFTTGEWEAGTKFGTFSITYALAT